MMKLRYEHLIGIEYKHGSNDCYGLIRRFYKDNFDLNLRNYARPHDWWNTDLSLYQLNYHKEGFRPLDAHLRTGVLPICS
jgi:cell wall-associated NlpC family hydrolase